MGREGGGGASAPTACLSGQAPGQPGKPHGSTASPLPPGGQGRSSPPPARTRWCFQATSRPATAPLPSSGPPARGVGRPAGYPPCSASAPGDVGLKPAHGQHPPPFSRRTTHSRTGAVRDAPPAPARTCRPPGRASRRRPPKEGRGCPCGAPIRPRAAPAANQRLAAAGRAGPLRARRVVACGGRAASRGAWPVCAAASKWGLAGLGRACSPPAAPSGHAQRVSTLRPGNARVGLSCEGLQQPSDTCAFSLGSSKVGAVVLGVCSPGQVPESQGLGVLGLTEALAVPFIGVGSR